MHQLVNNKLSQKFSSFFSPIKVIYKRTTRLVSKELGLYLRWSRGHKAQGQGQGYKKNPRPRPRTAFPRTDALEAKDRNAQGQGPRTQAQVLSKKKKVFTKIFQAISKKKKDLHKNFSSVLHKKTFSKKFFKRSTKF